MKKIAVISTLVSVVVLALAYYLILPVLSFNFLYLPVFVFLVAMVVMILSVQHVKTKEDYKLPQQLSSAVFIGATLYIVVSLVAS